MSRALLIFLVLAVAVGIAAVVWLLGSGDAPAPPDDGGSTVTAEAAQAAVEQLNVGVAHLENNQLQDAIGDFEVLVVEFPAEMAPAQNLVVAHLLTLDAGNAALNADNKQQTVQRTRDALTRLREHAPDGLATHVLAARLAKHGDDIPTALDELAAALEAAPDDLPTLYETYSIGRISQDAGVRNRALAALNRAFDVAPTNLWILLARIEEQFTAQNAALVETLEAGAPRWEQLAEGVQQRARIDIRDLVTGAITAVEADDWPTATRNCRQLSNVVRPEEATQSDRRLVERHALEFVLDEFSEPVTTLARTAWSPSESDISFAPFEELQLTLDHAVVSVVAADFDLDTFTDLAVAGNGRLEVFRREEAAWSPLFSTEIAVDAAGFAAFDLDDDVEIDTAGDAEDSPSAEPQGHPRCHRADLDFVVFGPSGLSLFENVKDEETRSLKPIPLTDGLASVTGVTRVVPSDLDADGDLDMIVLSDTGLTLWGNRGNLTFDSARFSPAGIAEGSTFLSVLPIDWDGDLDIDLVLGDAQNGISVLENLRYGEFQSRPLHADVGFAPQSIEPLDRGGLWELLIGGDGKVVTLRTDDASVFDAGVSIGELTGTPMSGLQLADLNNDRWLDVIARSDDGLSVLPGNNDDALAQPVVLVTPPMPEGIVAFDLADFDRDGLLDIVTVGTGVQLLRNTTDSDSGWIDVSLLAEQQKGGNLSASGRVNHYGIGSIVEARRGAWRQRQIVRTPSVHFGLGDAPQADAIRVLWTNGVPENVIEPEPRTFICERQSLKGSCPYLYGWNGERFAFITDLLWASPIGLVDPAGNIVPDRSWEYLKISGAQLQPRDGTYELRLTEELWEAAYFDSVRLYAIDHPLGVDVYTNEKVGPPSIAEHRLHTVTERRIPVKAVDQRGRDVLPLIAEEDEQYVRLFDHKLRQGYTQPTTLEVDLGELNDPQQVTLFLTGWIYPTDTTINIALSQNPDLAGPQPLSLAVPNAEGQWQTVMPFTGFPGGKTKTIAIDLSDVFLTDDYRLRLSTSNELYWDAIFFTVDEPPIEIRETELTLTRAELRHRGVSAVIEHPHYGPERYDYETVLPSKWRSMQGRFTRLGDVRDLLTDDDDQLLIIGSGDEVALEFGALDAPPEGWTRDFVIRNVGWDKDADLQTIYGQTVEPLPYRAMSRYPFLVEDTPPDSDEYREYLRTMQTREFLPGK